VLMLPPVCFASRREQSTLKGETSGSREWCSRTVEGEVRGSGVITGRAFTTIVSDDK
jgi:hypothetical protein